MAFFKYIIPEGVFNFDKFEEILTLCDRKWGRLLTFSTNKNYLK